MEKEIRETIAAIATPAGRGGVGIVRVSGPQVLAVARQLLGAVPKARLATYTDFVDGQQQVIDQGIAIYFKGPHSFTGEDVLELQAHGGPFILDALLREVLSHDQVRLAQPGEFSQQAFLNDKMDLVQAEAIADLIDASSEQAAKSALASMQGKFSEAIHQLLEALTYLRMYVEAAIDFPEEEIDFLSDGKVQQLTENLLEQFERLLANVKQGTLLKEGISIVIAGKPNAGKSSLLNALSGRDSAIVTDIPGTTRDVLREHIDIDGMPLHIIDTAGLRESDDPVEQEGIRRAWQEIEKADVILFLVDSTETTATDPHVVWPDFADKLPSSIKLMTVRNKVDLSQEQPGLRDGTLYLSLNTGDGLAELKQQLKTLAGFTGNTEGIFMARRRHLDALTRAYASTKTGINQLQQHQAGELLAEDLRQAQQALGEITGEFTSDDLLGKIFSSFCIGK